MLRVLYVVSRRRASRPRLTVARGPSRLSGNLDVRFSLSAGFRHTSYSYSLDQDDDHDTVVVAPNLEAVTDIWLVKTPLNVSKEVRPLPAPHRPPVMFHCRCSRHIHCSRSQGLQSSRSIVLDASFLSPPTHRPRRCYSAKGESRAIYS